MHSKKSNFFISISLLFGLILFLAGCDGEDPGQGDAGDQAVQFSFGISAIRKQVMPGAQGDALYSFSPSDIFVGEMLVTNTATSESETHFWSVYIDDESFEVQSNKTLILSPGEYHMSLLVGRGDEQYAGFAVASIVDGTNDIALTLKPIIGDTIVDVSVVTLLADFKFSYSPSELSGLTSPQMGIMVDHGVEEILAINPATGISDDYINLPEGSHNIRLKLYDGSLQVGKSLTEQEEVMVVAGLAIQLDLVPLHGEITIALAEEGADANFFFSIPGEVIEEVGDLSNLHATFKTIGPTNPFKQSDLTVEASGDEYVANLIFADFQLGSITLSLEFRDNTSNELIANCTILTAMLSSEKSLTCGIDLKKRSVISGHYLGVVGINVYDLFNQPVSGATVKEGSTTLGITGNDPAAFGTSNYLKVFLTEGTHTLRAESSTHWGEVTIAIEAGGEENPDIFLTNPLTSAGPTTLIGEVVDAPVAFAYLQLIEYGSKNPIGTPILTAIDGGFSLTEDLTSYADETVFALEVTGRQADLSTIMPKCSSDPTSDTFVDINKNSAFDISTDSCVGINASFVSILGTKGNINDMDLSSDGIIDSANLPALVVTHVTTAKALVLDTYFDSTDDTTIAAYHSSFETALNSESMLQRQVAVIAALYRAVNHGETLTARLDASLDALGIDALIQAILDEVYELDGTDLEFLEGIIETDDSQALADLLSGSNELDDVSFAEADDSPIVSATDPTKFELVNAKFEELLTAFKDNLESPSTSDPVTLKAAFLEDLHEDFLHNGRSGEQWADNWVSLVIDGMDGGGEHLSSVTFTNAELVRVASGDGPLYYDDTLDEATTDVTPWEIYSKKAMVTAVFPSTTFTFPMENPEMGLEGYVIYDATADLMLEMGNYEKFEIRFGARNRGGRREIELNIRDESHDSPDKLFDIVSVQVEVSDDDWGTFNPADLEWHDGGEFRDDCDLAEAIAAGELTNNYQCLNLFVLFFDEYDDEPYWGPIHGPVHSGIEHSYMIPQVWVPDHNTVFTITVEYVEMATSTPGTEVYHKKLKLFPTDEYLAKLLYDDNPEHLVDGTHEIGNDSSLSLNWRFRGDSDDRELVFPSDARIDIDLWDPIMEDDVPGFEYWVDSNQRSIDLSTDLSAYELLVLSIDLEMPDGSEAESSYQLVKNGMNWFAYPFDEIALSETYHVHDDKIYPANFEITEDFSLYLRSAFGQIASSIELTPNDFVGFPDLPSYDMTYDVWHSWWPVDSSGNWVGFRESGTDPYMRITFDPEYVVGGADMEIDYRKLYDANELHLVQGLDVSYDSNQIFAEWSDPSDDSTLNVDEHAVYWVEFSRNYTLDQDSQSFHYTDLKRYESPVMSGDQTSDHILIQVNAQHYGHLVTGAYTLICTIQQIMDGDCHQ